MLNPLAACASLGFGILVSPEILIIGLILASDRSHPRANTLGYFLGSSAGILLLLALGFFLTHSTGSSHPSGFAWWLRLILGGALVAYGLHLLWRQLQLKPETPPKESKLGAWLMKLLPVSEEPRPGGPLPSLTLCTALSFLLAVVHLKTIGLATSAGHVLHGAPGPAALTTALTVFLLLALFPALLPLALAVLHPETAVRARQVSQAVAEKHGAWILAIILLLVGIDFLHGAFGG
jgi:hypothetical protein